MVFSSWKTVLDSLISEEVDGALFQVGISPSFSIRDNRFASLELLRASASSVSSISFETLFHSNNVPYGSGLQRFQSYPYTVFEAIELG